MAEDNKPNPEATDGEPDFEKRYADAVAESRKWEERAKANKALADARADYDEVIKARDEAQAALEAMTSERDTLSSERDQLNAQIERRNLLDKVSAAKGVPANLLKGETEEELSASADALSQWMSSQQPNYPADTGGGAAAKPLTRESITSKPRDTARDRMSRLKERAQLIESESRG